MTAEPGAWPRKQLIMHSSGIIPQGVSSIMKWPVNNTSAAIERRLSSREASETKSILFLMKRGLLAWATAWHWTSLWTTEIQWIFSGSARPLTAALQFPRRRALPVAGPAVWTLSPRQLALITSLSLWCNRGLRCQGEVVFMDLSCFRQLLAPLNEKLLFWNLRFGWIPR